MKGAGILCFPTKALSILPVFKPLTTLKGPEDLEEDSLHCSNTVFVLH